MGQFSKVRTIRGSLEHISAFNPCINPISAEEAAVDDSLIQPDTGRGIHKDRKDSNSILLLSRDNIPNVSAEGFAGCKF